MVPNGKVEGRCPYAGSTVFRIFNRFFNSTLFEVDLLHIYVTKLAFLQKNTILIFGGLKCASKYVGYFK